MDVRALQLLQGVDHILHAGDIGDARIIEELQDVAPVTAVRGNVDRDPPSSLCPAEETLVLDNCRIYLTHEVKPPKRDTDSALEGYRQAEVDVVVYGHSHIAYQRRWGGVLFFNPGAAGKRRFKVIPSIGFITLTRTGVEGMVTPLEAAEGPGLPVMGPPTESSGR